MGIGTTSPHPSAKLHIQDTIRGLLLPRLTQAQRDAIPNPAHSLIIFNTDTNCFEAYDSIHNRWVPIACFCRAGCPRFSAWQYRVPVTIQNQTGITLTNYQVKILFNSQTLIASGKMLSSAADPYTINTPQTELWVKIPVLPPGQTTIYLYYGNFAAPPLANGDSVFLFFDDFTNPGLNPNKWTWGSANNSFSFSTGNSDLIIQNPGSSTASAIFGGIESKPTFSHGTLGDFAVDFKRVAFTLNSEQNNFGFGLYNDAQPPWAYGEIVPLFYYIRAEFNINQFRSYSSTGSITTTPLNVAWGTGIRHNATFILTKPANYRARLFVNGTLAADHLTNVSDTTYQIFIKHEDDPNVTAGETIRVDVIFVRKYAEPEPNAILGNEETCW